MPHSNSFFTASPEVFGEHRYSRLPRSRLLDIPWFFNSLSFKKLIAAGLLVLGFGLSGCSEEQADPAQAENFSELKSLSADTANHSDGSPVLAKVNGVPVTELDVELTINRTFSQAEQILLNEDVRQKTLESVVATRAMKQAAEKTMSASEAEMIRKRVQAYEEELFVKAYLEKNAEPVPVTTAMVEAYYHDNPERFGGGRVKTFAMLRTRSQPDEKLRDRLFAAISSIKNQKDWQASAQNWLTDYDLVYREDEVRKGLLDQPLLLAVSQLNEGEVSDVIYHRGIPYILRVTGYRELSPKPLNQVSGEIRKILAPQQLRKAVKSAMDEVLAEAQVVYINQ